MIISVPDPIGMLLHKALARGSKSSVLNPLGWFIVICAASCISSFSLRIPEWIGTTFGILFIVGSVFYLGFYAYFSFTGKEDCLRSEKFAIQKMAIQKGFYVGDDVTGLFKLSKSIKALPEGSKEDK